MKHKICKTIPIRKISKEYDPRDLNLLIAKIRRMANDIEKVSKDLTTDYDQVNNLTKACKEDIK